MEPAVFLRQLYEGAKETFPLYGIFPSVTAAQAILESDWGKSQLARECCNLFGIKADSGWKGEKKAYPTKEYDRHGQLYTVTAYFRKYASYADSLKDHGRFFQENQRYVNVIGLLNYRQQARAIQDAGYATDPRYAEKLIRLIEENGLWKWDQEVLTISSEKNVSFVTHVVSEGESVIRIAEKHGVTLQEIVEANHLNNPDLIFPGQKLAITISGENPGSKVYMVRGGDTLSTIAQRYGTSSERIASDNGIPDSNYIQAGQKILIRN